MNLFAGRASASGGTLSLAGPGWRVTVTGPGGDALRSHLPGADTAVTAGIRPEDLDLSGPGPDLASGPCITAEPLGSETLYNIDVAGATCRVLRRETAVSMPEGKTAPVHLRPGARLHLFGPDGTRIGGAVLNEDMTKANWSIDESRI